MTQLVSLDSKAVRLYQAMRITYPDPNEIYAQNLDTQVHPLVICEILYHLSRALPHLYMYSACIRRTDMSPEYIRFYAGLAVHQIHCYTKWLVYLIDKVPARSLPPFIGYAAFVAASLHLASFIYLTRADERGGSGDNNAILRTFRADALKSLVVMNRMRCFWASVRTMVSTDKETTKSYCNITTNISTHSC